MAGKRNLGMGLDLLLKANEGNKAESHKESVRSSAIASMAQAIEEDEKGNIFEAYHFYRRVIECLKEPGLINSPELCGLVSQALNNAAVILCENGKSESARTYLIQAIKLHPDNEIARENLQALWTV
jgi:tetratricopeptide (TPR) repeat protein